MPTNKEKLYLIIIIIFLIIFSAGIVLYTHTHNAGLTKSTLSRIASFGPFWILVSNEDLGGNDKFVETESSSDNLPKIDKLPKKLFGVQILDNSEKYLHTGSQGEEKTYGGGLKLTWYKGEDIKNLIKDSAFSKYHIAAIEGIVAVVQAQHNTSQGYVSQERFKDKCIDTREIVFTDFLKENNINRDLFNRKYYKGKPKTNGAFFIDRISTDYNFKKTKLRLYLTCNYGLKLVSGLENITSTFVLRLSTIQSSAAGEKDANYEPTSKFNTIYLKSLSLEK
jgi:hypothetical protein|tara:strand:- start:203 stop:1042 length:840 start_codon:yes stop_codon:yes gene_type:complete